MKKHNAVVLLSLLLNGGSVVKDGIKYVLTRSNWIRQEATSEEIEAGYLRVGFDGELKNFIDWANTFTDDEIALNIANSVLNKCVGGERNE